MENYRPITLQHCLENTRKFIFDALYPFLAPLINDCQCGFKKGSSPPLLLISYLNAIYRNASDPFLKIEEFDKINHQVLLYKLRQLGVGEATRSSPKLSLGQKQFVQLGDVRSPSITVASGVPRGSLLGPLLFLVYVSMYQDLPNDLTNDPYMFADETVLNLQEKR